MAINKSLRQNKVPCGEETDTTQLALLAVWPKGSLHVNNTKQIVLHAKRIFQVYNKLKTKLCLFFLEKFIYLATW